MKTPDLLTEQFEQNIHGSIGCFDRLVLYGTYKPIQYPKAIGYEIYSEGIKLMDYEKQFANKPRLQMTGRTKEIADRENIQIQPHAPSQATRPATPENHPNAEAVQDAQAHQASRKHL